MYLKLQDTQKTRFTSSKKKILSQKKLKNLTIEDLNLAIEIYETIFDSRVDEEATYIQHARDLLDLVRRC